ncbi:MAG: carboxypeptidase M32 [Bacteroidota bacterium]
MEQKYQSYVEKMQQIMDLQASIAVLSWDKEVNMPAKGARHRGQQVATLSALVHEKLIDPALEELVNELYDHRAKLDAIPAKNIERSWDTLQRVKKLDEDFVRRRSLTISKAYHGWLEAREANSFQTFQPHLEALLAIKREEADRQGYEDHPYDALLEEFEPGARVAQLDPLFDGVREHLTEFARKIRDRATLNDDFLYQHYPHQLQWDFGLQLLENMGYDFGAGRQDRSPHPFTINFSPQDVRVTTMIRENNFGVMTWSCLHEGGHALYEQGLPVDQYGLPCGKYVSLGIHESQSRLWENHVGRSYPYWQAHFAHLRSAFPEQLATIDARQFYQGINKVVPGKIRIEADELHYHFHVLIRYELEKALISGELPVSSLEEAWNQKYLDYLDVTVEHPNEGVLQDIHWAHGSVGYFPTYSLGSFYAAQFYATAKQEIPELEAQIADSKNGKLLQWLRENIHKHGHFYQAEELCERVTGQFLQYDYFRAYVEEKYGELYDL